MFDYLIVGAGFAGSVLAERLARGQNKKVLIIDRRSHIGGNAYDCHNEHGILIHQYGPHIFHTNSAEIFDYLSRFTEWRQYQHRVKAMVDGRLLPIPINLDTVNELYGLQLTPEGMKTYLASVAEKKEKILTSEDVERPKPAPDIYLRACSLLGVDPSRALALEDSVSGVAAAKAAGLTCIAVPMFAETDVSAADEVVDSLEKLLERSGGV